MVMITPTLIQDLAWKGYLIFMCLNLVFVPVPSPPSFFHCRLCWLLTICKQIIYLLYPETANLTLEEIDFLFMDRRTVGGHRSGSGVESGLAFAGDVREVGVKE